MKIIQDVLSSDYVHMFVSVPPKLAISDLMRLMKGRSCRKVQRGFPYLQKTQLGSTVLGQGVFNHQRTITEDVVHHVPGRRSPQLGSTG